MTIDSTIRQTRPIPVPDLRHFRISLYAGFTFSAVINLLLLSVPLYSLQVFTRAIPSYNMDTLLLLTLVTVIALTITAMLETVRARLFHRAGTWLDVAFRPKLVSESLQPGQRGKAATSLLSDLSEVRGFLVRPVFGALNDLPWTPLYLVGIYLVHPLLALVMVVGSIVLMLVAAAADALTRRPSEGARTAGGKAARMMETIAAKSDTIRALRMESSAVDRWASDAMTASAHGGTAYDRGALFGSLTKWLRYLLQIAVTGVGAALVMENHLSFGGLIATSMLIARAMTPFDQSAGGWGGMLTSLAAWRRLMPSLGHLCRPDANAGTPPGEGRLVVDGVHLVSGRDLPPILRNITFELEAGEMLCVFGPNRSGKSMLGKLLTGALRPHAGAVRLDGIDVADWRPADPMRSIAYVPQDVDLLPGTIAENISRFSGATLDEVIETARRCNLHDVVAALPDGYDTEVGTPGTHLSSGTMRLIALARAAFGHPAMIVLDEPVTNLDLQGHEAVRRFLAAAREQRITTVVLSHQSTFIEMADKVMVLKNGTIAAYGPRDQVVGPMARRPAPTPAAAAANAE
jgi:PrtD family type I secretion system ABC transporter